jgi:hypothetical protein
LKKNFIVAFNMDEKKILQLFSGLYYKAFQSINCKTESSIFWRAIFGALLARILLARTLLARTLLARTLLARTLLARTLLARFWGA